MQNTSYNQISVKPGIRTITILVLFFSTVLFVVQPAKGENGSWVISGEVTDELGNLIPNVEIVAQDSISMDNIASTISDENGYYTMVVPQGTYNLIVTPPPASGFESTTIPNIEVISDTTVNVILVPASTVTFNGYILDRGGEPVPNQRISLSTAGIVVRDTTDEQGFFSMQVSPGLYSLSLEPWGYAPNVPSWYWLYSDDPIQINQDMEMIINLPTRSFTGKVIDQNGAPIPDVRLFIQGGTSFAGFLGSYEYEITTNGNGDFSFIVFSGSASLAVIPPPDSPFGSKVLSELDLTEDVYLTIELTPALSFYGYILDCGGEPVPNQRISLSTASIVVRDTTDEQGFFSMQVSPGSYYLSLEPWGYAPNVPSWYWLYHDSPIQIDQDTEMIINLPTRSFTGKVIDQNGAPIPDVRLFIQGGTSFAGFLGSYEYEITTNGNGDFSFVVFSGSASLAATPPPDSPFGSKVLSELDLTEDVYLTIELTPALSFYGYILDRDGESVPNQQIRLSTASIVVRDATDEQGFFSMQVSPGLYYLSLEPWGYAPNVPSWYWLYSDNPIQIDQDTEMIIDLPTRSFTGKVIDQNGAPIPDVQLFIQGGTSFAGFLGSYEYEITTNGNGDFSFVVFSGSASLAVTPPPDSPFGPKLLTNLDLIDDEYSIIQLVPLAAPPNAVAGGPYYGIEGTAIILDASASNDPDGAIELYEWDVNGDGVFDISSVTSIANFIPSDDYEESITLQLTDDDGLTSQTTAEIVVENAAPILSDIIAPFDPVALGTPLLASASFSDPGILDTHDAVWDWGDSITSPGIVTEEGGSGTVNGDHVYTVPGVYTITLTLSDDDGGLDSTQFSYVVIYDNEQGFVTGGGWLTSPEGAFPTDPYLSGKANFGFVSKYKKGTTVPTGNTEFQFHAGDLNFHSDTYEWLVIAGAQALFKGTGTINGEGSYKFILTAVDGAINGGGDADKFRIKIWLENEETGEEDIIYDNQLLVIDGGSIKIHKG